MDLSYLHVEDWEEFERRYPGAVLFLRRRALLNEWKHLKGVHASGRASGWVQRRFHELDALFGGD